MKLTYQEITHFLLAVSALLVAAHGCAAIFRKFRQPPVIGEIVGGLILGPTILGKLFPTIFLTIFPHKEDMPSTDHILAAVHQMGLVLLMFCSGLEIRSSFGKSERKTAFLITLTGTLIPFGLGALAMFLFDPTPYMGAAGSKSAFLLVFAIAVAVTSIPVISRIFMDLGIIETPFAKIVLAAAVIEDILLYVVLAIAISMVGAHDESAWGLPRVLGFHGAGTASLVYHIGVNLAFFALALLCGPRIFKWADEFRYNVLKRSSRVGFLLLFLIAMTGFALYLGITPMFGAFVAGMVAASTVGEKDDRREVIKTSAFAFFVPIYFAIVGFKLDFSRGFDVVFFLAFMVFACLAKALSVFLGARMAGESKLGSTNIAVAMNARGGPGIVLASLAFDATIINAGFYTTLVLLSVLTSMAAGMWLERIKRLGKPLR
jgi:Kef-type K+ transport system membrane component KefB